MAPTNKARCRADAASARNRAPRANASPGAIRDLHAIEARGVVCDRRTDRAISEKCAEGGIDRIEWKSGFYIPTKVAGNRRLLAVSNSAISVARSRQVSATAL